MTDLIRNCAHYSTHQTLLNLSGNSCDTRTIKTTFSTEGVAGIQAEYDGLSWYASRCGQDISSMICLFRTTPSYARLETPYVNGTVIPMPVDPDTLVGKFNAAADHYISVFWDGVNTPSHGDYSISNHVFNRADDVLRIIDWEHFNNVLPPQYDPLYMVVEPFLFWNMNGKQPRTESINAGKAVIAKIFDAIGLENNAMESPATWLRQTANAHRAVWGHQADKVPFLNAAPEHIAVIDQVLGRS